MPKPTNSVARLVMATGGLEQQPHVDERLAPCAARPAPRAARITRPAPISPSVRALPQPHAFAWPIAYSGRTRPTARITAPRTSTRPGVRTGDSGITSSAATAAITAIAAPSQNSTW